ncbi:MAG: lytic transglycosylase domain-containing protein [Desulfomonile sp.]|nr:lytic transglycosylase domain-containing protein [Desulfomonile sp.]
MTRNSDIILPCTVLALVFFVLLGYPVISEEIERRLPLLSLLYIANHLADDVARVEAAESRFPPNYPMVLAEYGGLSNHDHMKSLAGLSAEVRQYAPPAGLLAVVILWSKGLPRDLLSADPVGRIEGDLATVRRKERVASVKRSEILAGESLVYLKHAPPAVRQKVSARKGLPPAVLEKGLAFCGEKVPLDRPDVRRRIVYQIEHLLGEMRDTTRIWLKRKDRYASVIEAILKKEGVPAELALLPALESGYNGAIVSPALARGWWQFLKTTATGSMSRDPALNWTLRVENWRDERSDLVLSTHSAARYLNWMRTRIADGSSPVSWLTVAAAYNAGLSEIVHRTGAYGTTSYWDMKLPLETENYVPRWIAFALIDAHREFYGVGNSGNSTISFDTLGGLHLSRDVPLSLLAALTASSVRLIRELNPGLNKSETSLRAIVDSRAVTHTIHVPKRCGDKVVNALREGGYLKSGPSQIETDRGARSEG